MGRPKKLSTAVAASEDGSRAGDDDTDASATNATTGGDAPGGSAAAKKRRKRRKALTEDEDVAILRAVLAVRPHHAPHGQGRKLWQQAADQVVAEVGGEMSTTLCKGRFDNLLKRFAHEQDTGGFWPRDPARRELVAAALNDLNAIEHTSDSHIGKIKKRSVELAVAAADRAMGENHTNPLPWTTPQQQQRLSGGTTTTAMTSSVPVSPATTTSTSTAPVGAAGVAKPAGSTAPAHGARSTSASPAAVTSTPTVATTTTPTTKQSATPSPALTPTSTTTTTGGAPSSQHAVAHWDMYRGTNVPKNLIGTQPAWKRQALAKGPRTDLAQAPATSQQPSTSATSTQPTPAAATTTTAPERAPAGPPARARAVVGSPPSPSVSPAAQLALNKRIANTYRSITGGVVPQPYAYSSPIPVGRGPTPPAPVAHAQSAKHVPKKASTTTSASTAAQPKPVTTTSTSTATPPTVARSSTMTTAQATVTASSSPSATTPAKPANFQKVVRAPSLNSGVPSPPSQPPPRPSVLGAPLPWEVVRANTMSVMKAAAKTSASLAARTSSSVAAAHTTATTTSGTPATPPTSSVAPPPRSSQTSTPTTSTQPDRPNSSAPTTLRPHSSNPAASAASVHLNRAAPPVRQSSPFQSRSGPGSASNYSMRGGESIAQVLRGSQTNQPTYGPTPPLSSSVASTPTERAWLEDRNRDRERPSSRNGSTGRERASSGSSAEDLQDLVREMRMRRQEQAQLKQHVASLSAALEATQNERTQLHDQVSLLAAMVDESQQERTELKRDVASLTSLLKDVAGHAGILRRLDDAQQRQADELRRYQQEEEARRRVAQIDDRARVDAVEQRLDLLEQNASEVEHGEVQREPSPQGFGNESGRSRHATPKKSRTFNPFAELQATLEKQQELIKLYEQALATQDSHSHTELELAELRTAIEVERSDRAREYMALLDSIKHIVSHDEST